MAILQAKTVGGIVEGLPAWNQAYTIFKGIPFAAPPVGDFRWKAPQPVIPWEGVKQCYKFGPLAMQEGYVSEGGDVIGDEFYVGSYEKSEDCLYLNIWTPAKTPDEKLPVCIYFHGGGFTTGYSYLNCYDGESFCKRGMIMVSASYRLNVFGFMAHPELTAESEHHSSGNYGVMDQVAAIKWVKENISNFGGDPNHIALFGQSAGGMSVMNMSLTPLTDGMFQYAIIQSGGGGLEEKKGGISQAPLATAEEMGKKFFEFAGISSLAEARSIPAEIILEKLHGFATTPITDAEKAMGENKGFIRSFIRFSPCADGYVLPKTSREILLAGEHHKDVHYMIGCAEGDSKLFGDARTGVLQFAQNQLKLGINPAYVYYFTYVPPGAKEAHHSVEHHYVFQTLLRSNRPYTGFDFDLSNELADYWANFMKTGNPNGNSEDKWTPYTAESPCYLEIAEERSMKSL